MRSVLGRTGDAAGAAGWAAHLTSGATSLGDVALAPLLSDGFAARAHG
jgi:hypothetical protein